MVRAHLTSNRWSLLCGFLLLGLGGTSQGLAWTDKTQVAITDSARRIAPPALARQLDRHRDRFRDGVLAPFSQSSASDREHNADGSGRLHEVIAQQVEWAIQAIEQHEPFPEIAYRLGTLAHYVALANNPLQTANTDSWEPRFGADFNRYVESAQGRFRLVFYGQLDSFGGVDRALQSTFSRARRDYSMIGREYRRIGSIDGRKLFDDRSTAFAVSAVSFNHAVSDIARMLRYIWIEAGGVDTRSGGRALRPPRKPS